METTVQTSKPSSLKASSLPVPRRVTRSANNPPAHPEDERRRAGSGLPAWDILPKPSLSGVRVTRRGNQLHPLFFHFFFLSPNSPPKILSKAFPRDLPGTPKSLEIRFFAKKSRPKVHLFVHFLVDLCFSHLVARFFIIFSSTKT